jgi:shikimate kinase
VNILLMGLRGCGKSTVGRLLAERTNRRFVDLDERTLATFDEPSVSAVWSAHGEAAWRRVEAQVLDETLRAANQVVALGGGTPMIEDARRRIEAHRRDGCAKVVYLRCDSDELGRRLEGQTEDRPSLTGADPLDEIEAVREAREPTYRQLADVEYDVTRASPQEAAESIGKALAA